MKQFLVLVTFIAFFFIIYPARADATIECLKNDTPATLHCDTGNACTLKLTSFDYSSYCFNTTPHNWTPTILLPNSQSLKTIAPSREVANITLTNTTLTATEKLAKASAILEELSVPAVLVGLPASWNLPHKFVSLDIYLHANDQYIFSTDNVDTVAGFPIWQVTGKSVSNIGPDEKPDGPLPLENKPLTYYYISKNNWVDTVHLSVDSGVRDGSEILIASSPDNTDSTNISLVTDKPLVVLHPKELILLTYDGNKRNWRVGL
jgi:hypothetical protein